VTARPIEIDGYTLTYVEGHTVGSGVIPASGTLVLRLFYQMNAVVGPPVAITITAASDEKIFDGTPLVNSGFIAGGSALAGGDVIASVAVTGSQTYVLRDDGYNIIGSPNVASNAVIMGGEDGSEDVTHNYDITYIDGLLTVYPAQLVITVRDMTLVQGSPIPGRFYIDVEGFRGDDGPEVISGVALFHTDYTPDARAGETFPIELTGLYAKNYDISFFPGLITVVDEGDEPGDNEPGDNEPGDNEPGGNEPGDNEPGGNEPEGGATIDPETGFPDVEVIINDEETGLAGMAVPITPHAPPLMYSAYWALLNLILTITTALITVFMIVLSFINRKDADWYMEEQGGNTLLIRETIMFRLLGIATTIIAVVLFTSTQDINLTMAFTDRWTIWHEIITAATILLAWISRKRYKEADEDPAAVLS